MTFKDRLAEAEYRPAGFDYLRIGLAAAVILVHGVDVAYGSKVGRTLFEMPWRLVVIPIIPMFFALSGFLVAGSLYRCKTTVSFLALRVLRLLPALAVEVMLCALILGPIFTKLPLAEYFTAPDFYRYFLNLVGIIQYVLPGVFTENPWAHTVNAQLWTVPFELECYIALAVLAATGITARRSWLMGAAFAGQILLAVFVAFKLTQFHSGNATGSFWPDIQAFQRSLLDQGGGAQQIVGRLSVMCFIAGVAFYACADAIRAKFSWFVASIVATAVLCTLPLGEYLAVFPIVYATVYLGTLNPPRQKALLKGDYSYGIYLYGFPLQQAVMVLLPGIAWYQNALLGLLLAFACAYFSWWYIEKPALGLKPWLMRWTGEPSGGKANGSSRVAGSQIANAG